MNGLEEPKEDLTRRKEGSTTAVQFSSHLTHERLAVRLVVDAKKAPRRLYNSVVISRMIAVTLIVISCLQTNVTR